MKKVDVVKFYHVLSSLKKDERPSSPKFKYAILKNLNNIMPEIQALLDMEKEQSEIIQEFSEARNELIKKYGKNLEGGGIGIPTDDKDAVAKFNEALSELITNSKEAIDKYDKVMKDYNLFLTEEDADSSGFHKINLSEAPDWLTGDHMEIFIKMDIM